MANTESVSKIGFVGRDAVERLIENTKVNINTRVPIDHGEENAGRTLLVGDDGKVTLGGILPKIISVTQSEYDELTYYGNIEQDAMYLIARDDP